MTIFIGNVNEKAQKLVLAPPVNDGANSEDSLGEIQVLDPDVGDTVQIQVLSGDVCPGRGSCRKTVSCNCMFIRGQVHCAPNTLCNMSCCFLQQKRGTSCRSRLRRRRRGRGRGRRRRQRRRRRRRNRKRNRRRRVKAAAVDGANNRLTETFDLDVSDPEDEIPVRSADHVCQ